MSSFSQNSSVIFKINSGLQDEQGCLQMIPFVSLMKVYPTFPTSIERVASPELVTTTIPLTSVVKLAPRDFSLLTSFTLTQAPSMGALDPASFTEIVRSDSSQTLGLRLSVIECKQSLQSVFVQYMSTDVVLGLYPGAETST
eukprot:TRINITY_DN11422_c0_g1_i1.p1 TRINITY_DN11422_c0_g1~~TRINITY_DN11422_c0_g1_i1.p1  ORF type:complete len:142 (+),score=4.10 TRINITY_DN11422_c0_g1_i1:116-541(+)